MERRATTPPIHLSQGAFLMPVTSFFEERGISVESYLQQVGLPPTLAEDEASFFSRKLIFRFVNQICEAEGIEDFGLLVGSATSLQDMGELGEWMLMADTVHGYLARGCKVINQVLTGDYYWLEDEANSLRFCASVPSLDPPDRVQNHLYILLITINTIGNIIDQKWQPEEITIPLMSAETARSLSKLLPDTKVITTGTHASFLISKELLDLPRPSPEVSMHFPPIAVPDNFLDSVRTIIKAQMVAGIPDVSSTADAAGIPRRTLQRLLKAHETSFTALALEIRIDQAKQWIHEREYSIAEISARLGYTDPANFSRAFQREVGLSPQEYSRGLRET